MKRLLSAGLTLSLLYPLAASAGQVSDSLSVTGFFSLDATYTNNAEASIPRPQGKDSDLDENEVNFDSSVYGARADLDIYSGLGASLQVVGTKQTDDSYDPEVEWAYLKYDFANDLSVRAGQLKLPFLKGTELRYIGNARLWARPIVPINGAGGFDIFRGAEVYYNTYYGDYDIQLHASLGEPEHDLGFIQDTWLALVSAEVDSGDGTIRLSLLQAGFDIYSKDNELLYDNSSLKMGSLEGEYQWDNWVSYGGIATGTAYSHPDEYLAYLSLGYRFDRFTPYALYSRKVMMFESLAFFGEADGDQLNDEGGGGESELPPRSAPSEPAPEPVGEQDGERIENTVAIGVRYDLAPNLSVKFQWDYQEVNDKSWIGQPDRDIKSNIYTIVFEGVF